MKVYYYANIEHDYSRAMEYMRLLKDTNCQLSEVNKGIFTISLYIASKQYNLAASEIKRLDVMTKTELQEFGLFYCKLTIAMMNNDGNEIQQLLDKNEKICQYAENHNYGKIVNGFRLLSVAYQQSEDNELAQLVRSLNKDASFFTKDISYSVILYTADWNRKI